MPDDKALKTANYMYSERKTGEYSVLLRKEILNLQANARSQ